LLADSVEIVFTLEMKQELWNIRNKEHPCDRFWKWMQCRVKPDI